METIKTDLLVIGAGSGGLSLAAGAVQMGARVVLLEGHKMGGDCLNYGCVPSKALLAAGKAAHAMTAGSGFGVKSTVPEVSYSDAKDHVKDVVSAIEPHDSQERFERLGVNVIREYGEFISPTEVRAGNSVIRARRIVVATGSSPLVPNIPGLEDVSHETNETIFELREAPQHLLVIGGGPIGLEMAQAHARLGCRVTVLEGEKALGKDDPELAAFVLEKLRQEGVEIIEGALAAKIRNMDGKIEVECSNGDVCSGSHLLVAVGRKPNIERLNLDAANIKTSRAGIKVDASLRTANRRVYAIGDVAGGMQFTHVAGYHAGIVIRSALFGLPSRASHDHIPWSTYTDPELAHVGLIEPDARKKYGDDLEVVRFPYEQNDRSIAERKTAGLIKVMAVKGRPVGVSIAGAQAGEHIALWSLVIANRLKMKHVAGMVAPYPTISEIGKRAAGAYFTPRLFDNPKIKRVVGLVQKWLP